MFTLFGFSVSQDWRTIGLDFCTICGGNFYGGLLYFSKSEYELNWDFLFFHSLYKLVKANQS